MSTTRDSSVSFDQTDTRSDEMNSTIEQWIDDLVAGVDDAQASAEWDYLVTARQQFGSETASAGGSGADR